MTDAATQTDPDGRSCASAAVGHWEAAIGHAIRIRRDPVSQNPGQAISRNSERCLAFRPRGEATHCP